MTVTITRSDWSDIVAAKQARNSKLIPAEWRIQAADSVHVMDVPASCGILEERELAITETSAQELVQQMSVGKLKSYDVVKAFAKRASIAQQLVRLQPCEADCRRTASLRSTLKTRSSAPERLTMRTRGTGQ